MNVNIKLEDNSQPQQQQQQPFYPQVNPVNFTIPPVPMPQGDSPLISNAPNINQYQTREIDLNPSNEDCVRLSQEILDKTMKITELEDKNKFLQILLRIYQNNPLYIKSIIVCKSKDFMDLIKLLTKCDKVDLVLNDDIACSGCGADSKFIYVSKILITKGDETKEMKYCYNEAYSKLISFGISTKIVC